MNKKYFLYQLKSKSWIGILFSAFLFITYIITMTIAKPVLTRSYRYTVLSLTYITTTTLIYAVFIFISTLFVFSYFDKKQKIDLYHSLPIKRNTLIMSNYFIVPILLTIPFIIFNVIFTLHLKSIILTSATSNNLEYLFKIINKSLFLLFKITLDSLFFYSLMVFISTKTGRTMAHGFVTLITVISPFVIILFTAFIMYLTINKGLFVNTIFVISSNLYNYFSYKKLSTFQIISIITLIIANIIMPFLISKSYANFKSENVEKFITSSKLTTFYLALSSLSVSVVILLIMYNFSGNISSAFTIPIFILINLLFYFIFASIFAQSISIKNIKASALTIILAVSVCYSFVFISDGLNISGITPNINKVTSISIDGKSVPVSQIQKVYDLQAKCELTGAKSKSPYNSEYSYNNFYTSIEIVYSLGDNKSLKRIYYMPENSVIYDDLTEIFSTEDYKNLVIEHIIELKNNNINLTFDTPSFSINDISDTNVIYKDDINKLYDALIKDIENDDNFGYYKYSNLKFINIYLGSLTFENLYYKTYGDSYLNIGLDYTNTIDVMHEIYKKENGSNAEFTDKFILQVSENSNLTERLLGAQDIGNKYMSVEYYYNDHYKDYYVNTSYNDSNIKTYSYSSDRAEFLDFVLAENFYNNTYNDSLNILPTDGEKINYIVGYGNYNQ